MIAARSSAVESEFPFFPQECVCLCVYVCLDGPQDLSEKPFFGGLVGYITSGPVVCIALEGDGVVASARKMIGATKPLEAEPGTIRGDLAIEVEHNVNIRCRIARDVVLFRL